MANGTGRIFEKIINFKAYVDGAASASAIVDVDLPEIQYMTETITGAGIGGEIESPTLGHTGAMTATFNIRTYIGDDFKLLKQKAYQIELRATPQSTVMSTGEIEVNKLSVVMKGTPKSLTTGKVAVGKATDSKIDFAVSYIKVEYNGETELEIDKINMICNIGGSDILEAVRQYLG